MSSKKAVSILLVIVMLMAVVMIPGSFSAQSADIVDVAAAAADYNLTAKIAQGNILHAFNWRMTDLVKYAPEIAAAGYSTVQISPIQTTKVTANDGSYATDWWCFYQPTDMKIGNALGSAADLKAATTELHKYGIKVIADVVTNHVMNCETKADQALVSSNIKGYTRRGLAVNNLKNCSDSSRDAQTQNDLDKQLPDLDTSNKNYQNYVINNLLLPLIDNGVDGFRFDAAKHIETPDDSVGSDYWPTVTNAIKNKKSDAFIYGEVLDNAGKFNISSYTKYMSVTDFRYGSTVRSAVVSKNASGLVDYGYSGSQKNQNVLWVESHDNFCSQQSTSLTKQQQILGWAAIGARADAPALFYIRPQHEKLDSPGFIMYDELMGAPGSATTWKDPTVVAVNHFKNAFAGQGETVTASGAFLYVQRGTTGMVIVNLAGTSSSVNQSCSMASGSYTDQVSGNTFQVSGGKITGNIGSAGVAVIYNKTADNSAPIITLKLNGTELNPEVLSRYTAATANIEVNLKDATSGTIQVSNLSAVTVKGGKTTFTLNSGIAYGKSVDVKITATNGKKTVTRTYNIKKKDANETKKVYFENSTMKWPAVYVYCKTGVAPSTQIANYDAYQLTGSGTLLSYTVPANTKYVKFNEGYIPASGDSYGRKHLFHNFNECQGYCGRTMPETVVNYGTANNKANRENGGYELVGAMILKDLRFEDYGDYPVATLKASDTSLKGSGSDPTQPTENPTEKPTTATEAPQPTTGPITPGAKLYRGDADLDGDVTIVDATAIQRDLAELTKLSANARIAADADKDGDLTIIDATAIQRYLAELGNPYGIGDVISGGSDPTPTEAPENPTEPPYEDPTDAPVQTQPLKNRWVAMVYCEEYSTDPAERTKQFDIDQQTATLTMDFPGASYVFCRNYDTGVQYCTNGWAGFVNPVTLVSQKSLENESDFEKMYVPAGTHTLYLIDNGDDTFTLGYDGGVTPGPSVVDPTTGGDTPVVGGDDIIFTPGAASVDNPAWYAWVWKDGSDGTWIKGTESGSTIIFANAAGYDNILVARMPTGSNDPSWSSCWNQSEDCKITGTNLVFSSWGSGNKFIVAFQ